jgi:hypothetical protein
VGQGNPSRRHQVGVTNYPVFPFREAHQRISARGQNRKCSRWSPFFGSMFRFEARDRTLSCAGARCRRGTKRGASNRNGAERFRQRGSYLSRPHDESNPSIWARDAGSRQRRHRTLQRVHLRRKRGELTGYSFQIRLLVCGALGERHQHSCVLLLRRLKIPVRQLNIPQSRTDEGIRYPDCSRLAWRRCKEAIEIR